MCIPIFSGFYTWVHAKIVVSCVCEVEQFKREKNRPRSMGPKPPAAVAAAKILQGMPPTMQLDFIRDGVLYDTKSADTTRPTIPQFFSGQDVFVTGGSGFMGKVLIEKLTRSCPDINRIFILLRAKKGKTMQERMQHMINLPVSTMSLSGYRTFLARPKLNYSRVGGLCAVDGWVVFMFFSGCLPEKYKSVALEEIHPLLCFPRNSKFS